MPLDVRSTAMVITLTCRHVGIAMPAEEGFEFVATDPDFELLDGSSFRRLEQLEPAAQSMARVVKGSSSSEMIAVPIDGAAAVACDRSQERLISIKPVDKIVLLG
jgi:hypothetical protein